MKSPPTATTDDCDDIFGPPRTYPTGYCPPKNRPSMISAKYRQKEERRKVLKISLNKLKRIEDPEASLCRSVLINNTMKRLQKETRDEKLQKQQLSYPRCYDNESYLNCKRNTTSFSTENFVVENDFDAKLEEEINEVKAKNMEVMNMVEENLNGLTDSNNFQRSEDTITQPLDTTSRLTSCNKRTVDEMDDCDVQDVLSQFYMPPTPRMLTCIDDDEDVNVVDDEPLPKKLKMDVAADNELCSNEDRLTCDKALTDFSVNSFLNNNVPSSDARLRYSSQNVDTESNSYSCGHASLFGDLQNNVYHNLIASLET